LYIGGMGQPRVSYPGAIHHVYDRCNNKEALLKPRDLQMIMGLLQTCKKKFGFKLFGFSLLNNHYHLLPQVGHEHPLSKALHWLNWMSAYLLNKHHGRVGHLWQSRFKSPLIETEHYLLRCMLYIDLNPVRAGLVKDPRDWPFGSATYLLRGSPSQLVDPSPAYLTLGKNSKERLKQYKRLLNEALERTLALKKAIRVENQKEILYWLAKQPEEPIPFRRELSRLLKGRLKRHLRYLQG
jgi:putative transposase